MKLVLDKNFIREIENPTKEQEKGIKYHGFTKDNKQIELYDMEANKIAPIVRFLAEGKKGKINWFLISLAGFALLLLFGVLLWIMWPSSNNIQVKNETIKPVETKPAVEIVKTETQTKTQKETSWALELANEVDMVKDQKTSAENEVLRLNYEIERLNIAFEAKKEENKILKEENEKLKKENDILKTRKTEGATDEFIYYLGDSVYQMCQNPTTEEKIDKCKTLYFNFLEYGKR